MLRADTNEGQEPIVDQAPSSYQLLPVVSETPYVQQELGQEAKTKSVGAIVVHEAAEWLSTRGFSQGRHGLHNI